MGVPQFTTPTFTLTFTEQGLDLTAARNVYVTFKSCGYVLTKSGDDLTLAEKTINVRLSQKETSMFRIGTVDIQANWTTENGNRCASDVAQCDISNQLLKKVVE